MIELTSIILVYSNGKTRRVSVPSLIEAIQASTGGSSEKIRCSICGNSYTSKGIANYENYCRDRLKREIQKVEGAK